jgi:hypothetical protein
VKYLLILLMPIAAMAGQQTSNEQIFMDAIRRCPSECKAIGGVWSGLLKPEPKRLTCACVRGDK